MPASATCVPSCTPRTLTSIARSIHAATLVERLHWRTDAGVVDPDVDATGARRPPASASTPLRDVTGHGLHPLACVQLCARRRTARHRRRRGHATAAPAVRSRARGPDIACALPVITTEGAAAIDSSSAGPMNQILCPDRSSVQSRRRSVHFRARTEYARGFRHLILSTGRRSSFFVGQEMRLCGGRCRSFPPSWARSALRASGALATGRHGPPKAGSFGTPRTASRASCPRLVSPVPGAAPRTLLVFWSREGVIDPEAGANLVGDLVHQSLGTMTVRAGRARPCDCRDRTWNSA